MSKKIVKLAHASMRGKDSQNIQEDNVLLRFTKTFIAPAIMGGIGAIVSIAVLQVNITDLNQRVRAQEARSEDIVTRLTITEQRVNTLEELSKDIRDDVKDTRAKVTELYIKLAQTGR